VTIKQILKSQQPGGKFRIDEKDQSQVTFVGQIIALEEESTKVTYQLDDGSGQINVVIYSEMDSSTQDFKQGAYVRVVGNIRLLDSHLTVVGFKLVPVTDFNEVTFHMLEVIHSHLVNTKGKQGGSSSSSSQRTSFSSSSSQAQFQQQQQQQQQQPQFAGDLGGGGESDFNPLQQAIMLVFQKEGGQDERGVSTGFICSSLPQHSEAEIKKSDRIFKFRGSSVQYH